MDHCELSYAVRNLAIALLDDNDGINSEAMNHLRPLLEEYGHTDVLEVLMCTDDRYYVTTHGAAMLRGEQ